MKAAHEHAFGLAYRNAGEFRTDERGVQDNKTGKVWEATFSKNIERDLGKLTAEARELCAEAGTEQDFARVISYYHAKFEAIHPFEDGNGRLGRAIAEAQAESLLARSLALELGNQESYGLAFRDARERGSLALMAAVLVDTELDHDHRESPHSVEVWPQCIEKATRQGLVYFVEAENLSRATTLDAEAVPREVSDYVESLGSDSLKLTPGKDGKLELAERCILERDGDHREERAYERQEEFRDFLEDARETQETDWASTPPKSVEEADRAYEPDDE